MTHYYMYVTQCNDGTFYTGYTTDLTRRINAHNTGKGAKYTKTRRPIILLYAQEYSTKADALRAEYQFKQKTRQQKMTFLIEKGALTHFPIIELLIKEDSHEKKKL